MGTAPNRVSLGLNINYPDLEMQRQRIDAHARAAGGGGLFSAGAFTRIMRESGMQSAMAEAAVALLPPGSGAYLPVALGLLSMPVNLFFDPDSFYFGVLSVLAEDKRLSEWRRCTWRRPRSWAR